MGEIIGVAQYFISPLSVTPQLYSIALMIISAGATAAMVFAGLYHIKQLRYLKFATLMIISSFIMSFSVSIKVYLDILSNSPFKWTKTERSGNVRLHARAKSLYNTSMKVILTEDWKRSPRSR
jgi:hypothetical protein